MQPSTHAEELRTFRTSSCGEAQTLFELDSNPGSATECVTTHIPGAGRVGDATIRCCPQRPTHMVLKSWSLSSRVPRQPFLGVSSWEKLAPRRNTSLLTSWILLSGGQIFTPATSHLATMKGAREGKTQPGAAHVSPAMGLHSLPHLTHPGLRLSRAPAALPPIHTPVQLCERGTGLPSASRSGPW